MKKFLLLLLIVILAYFLRLKNYYQIPLPGQSMDEYSYSWVGLSMIKLGLPVGMSGIPGYKNLQTRYVNVDRVFESTARGNPVYINYPWFDHPPLLGLITGGYAYTKGAQVFEDTVAVIIRKPMIIIGTLAVGLVIILAYINFGFGTAFISGLLYATMPLVVISSRMIQAENGVVPMLLANLIFLSLYFKKRDFRFLVAAGVTAGLAPLFKLTGMTVLFTDVFLLWVEKSMKIKEAILEIVIIAVIALPFVSLYFIFGLMQDPQTFINIFAFNSSRFYGIGAAAINNLFLETRITQDKTLADVWVLVLWIFFLISFYMKRIFADKIIQTAVFMYLFVYVIIGSWPYGWQALPFWPILSIIFARVITFALGENKNLFPIVLLLTFPVTQHITRFIDVRNFQKYADLWKYGFGFFLLSIFIYSYLSPKRNMLVKILIMAVFLLAVGLNIKFIQGITIDSWYKLN